MKKMYNFMYRHFAIYRDIRFKIWKIYLFIFESEWIKSLKERRDSKNRSGILMNFSMSGNKRARNKSETEREYYSKEILQPFNSNGSINKDFLKIYGDSIYKSKGMTDEQIHNN